MTRALHALGRACARHHVVVIAVWLVAVVALAAVSSSIGQQTSDNLVLPGTDSQRASDILTARFPQQANGTNPVAMRAPSGKKLSDQQQKDAIDNVVDAYKKDPGVQKVVSPLSSDGSGQLTKDGSIGYISLTLKDAPSELTKDEAQSLIDVADPVKAAGIHVAAGGYLGQKVSKPSTHTSEVVGLVAAVVILLFTFGSAVAMGLPIITALIGLVAGLSIFAVLGQSVEIPTTAPALATMIGLGVGIDYGLFIVTRHRDQLRAGMEVRESIARTTATSGGAVLFAGSTVIIALLSLAVAGIPLVTTLGYTSAIVVLIAVTAATTLMPAILGLLGPRVNALPLPGMRAHHDERPHGWQRWARFVADHPWPAVLAGVVILLVLAAPLRDLHLGQTNIGALPRDTQSRQAYDRMTRGFGAGSNGPMLIAVDLSKPATNDQKQLDSVKQQQSDQQAQQQQQQDQAKNSDQAAQTQQQEQFLESKASDPRLQTLRTDLQKTKGVKSVTQPLVNSDGTRRRLHAHRHDRAVLAQDRGPRGHPARHRHPQGHQGPGDDRRRRRHDRGLHRPRQADRRQAPARDRPRARAVVRAARAGLPLAARAAEGRGHEPALDRRGVRHRHVRVRPPLVGDVRRARRRGPDRLVRAAHDVRDPVRALDGLRGLPHDPRPGALPGRRAIRTSAVIEGLAGTARVITSAALIMVSVFCAFIINGDPNIKQFGLGMAAAVAVDATIVRCLLVPAVMSLLGRSAWWMPSWLDRAMPHLSIEGEDYFAERDAAGPPRRPRAGRGDRTPAGV